MFIIFLSRQARVGSIKGEEKLSINTTGIKTAKIHSEIGLWGKARWRFLGLIIPTVLIG